MSLVRPVMSAAVLGRSITGAEFLLRSEPNGLALDFLDMSAKVKDETAPANNFRGDPNDLLTYTSPSTKYIRNKAGVYVAGTTLRTEYDTSGDPLGILVEEARTNLLLNNRTLDNAAGGWTETDATVTLNNRTAIDGATSADKIESTTGATPCSISRTFTGTAAAYIFSAIVENDDCGWCALSLNDGTTEELKNFNIAAGSLGSDGANAPDSSGIENLGSGRYRCWIVSTMAVASCTATLYVTDGDNASDPDVGEGLWADFLDVQLGLFLTSPIVTAASSVTRAADDISWDSSAVSWIGGAAMTLYAAAQYPATTYGSLIRMDSGDNTNSRVLTANVNLKGRCLSRTASTDDGSAATDNLVSAYTPFKLAGACALNDLACVLDGGTAVADTSVAVPIGISTCYFGQDFNGATPLNGHLGQAMIIPRRMSNAESQALTS